jgi:hypothetical protein
MTLTAKNKLTRIVKLLALNSLAVYHHVYLQKYGALDLQDLTEAQLEETERELVAKHKLLLRDVPNKERKLRSAILVQLNQMGVGEGNNWNQINKYLLEPRVCGKLLFECSFIELKALSSRLRAIDKKERPRREHLEFIAKNN